MSASNQSRNPDSDWVYQILRQNDPTKLKTCILLHGWTGDEHSMDVFLRVIPEDYAVLSPRGPIKTGEGGYGWVAFRPGNLAPYEDFHKSSQELIMHLDQWIYQNHLPFGKLTLIGFSQGAALALSFGIAFPEKVERIACLSGFLPRMSLPEPSTPNLNELKLFIFHGTQDKMIPIKRAYEAADWFRQVGATVITCEANIGHRLSANCFRGLKDFLK